MLLRLISTLPRARRWVKQTTAEHAGIAKRLSELELPRLSSIVQPALLERVRLVELERVPRPPLEQWNMHGADDFVGFTAAGLTLAQTIFVRLGRAEDESLIFHELVHVIQWETLGVNGFLAMYGLDLLRHGYENSPLEVMAYKLQERFNTGHAAFALEPVVQRRTQELLATFKRQSALHRLAGVALSIAPGRLPGASARDSHI